MKPQMVIFKDQEGKYRFRLVAANGEPIAQSESYEAKQSIKDLQAVHFPSFEIEDRTGEV